MALRFLSFLCCIKPLEEWGSSINSLDSIPSLNVPPAKLPSPRVNLTRPSSIRRNSFEEPRCRLLSLPAELRDKIWRECMTGMTFHLVVHVLQTLQLRYHMCERPGFPESCRRCVTSWNYWELNQNDSWSYDANVSKPQLRSMLFVCQQIYHEAVHHLYASNIFEASNPTVVTLLPHVILPQRLNAITNFQLFWLFKYTPPYIYLPPLDTTPREDKERKVWVEVWAALAQMKGLEMLHVELRASRSQMWGYVREETEIEIVEPIRAVMAPKKFELVLPFRRRPERNQWETLPCTIVWLDPSRGLVV